MRKKIALLLAVVMTIALLPTNVFAAGYSQSFVLDRASSNRGKTFLVEKGSNKDPGYGGQEEDENEFDDADWIRRAPELLIEFRGGVLTGDQFYVNLEGGGGKFALARIQDKLSQVNNSSYIPTTTENGYEMIDGAYGSFLTRAQVRDEFGSSQVGGLGTYFRKGSRADIDYDVDDYDHLGVSGPNSYFGRVGTTTDLNGESLSSDKSAIPEYTGGREQMAYTMAFISETEALVTVLSENLELDSQSAVAVIPLPIVADENGRVTVQVSPRQGSNSRIGASAKLLAVEGVSSAVSITLDPVITNYELFPIKAVKVNELRSGSVAGDGTFTITAPTGFEFINPGEVDNTYTLGNVVQTWVWNDDTVASKGIRNSTTGYYVTGWVWDPVAADEPEEQIEANYRNTTYGTWDYSALFGWIINYNWNLTQTTNYAEYDIDLKDASVVYYGGFKSGSPYIDRIYFKTTRNGDIDKTKAFIKYNGLVPSTVERGVVEFIDLPLLLKASENAAMGDVLVDIKEDSDCNIEQNSVKAGYRANWGITFKTTSDVTTLYNGQYESDATSDAWHKVAKMRFEEVLPNSWLANRKTEFRFPEGIIISKVKIDELSNISDESIDNEYDIDTRPGEVFKQGYVTVEDNVISLSGITLKKTSDNEKAGFDLQVWVSVEAGWEGDLAVTLGGTAITDVLDPLKVAEVKNPVIVKADAVTDIKIGYQYQSTANFTITEAKAGILRKGDTLKVSLTDGIDVNDMSFVDAKASVLEGGNLAIKNFKVSGYSNSNSSSANLGANSSGTISFDIDKASSVASTIEFTNVQVKIDRTIPETNYTPYKIVAWGNAVANNYDATTNAKPASFTTPGIMVDYIKVATLASGNALNSKVEVTVDSNTIYVNGIAYESDVAAYIDPANDSLMMPVRFVAEALGISPDSVQWADESKTVTIYTDTRVIQFTVGSDQIIVNGVASPMTAADNSGRPVAAVNKDSRTFIPFRSLGNALGVPVGWDSETLTATFNPDTAY